MYVSKKVLRNEDDAEFRKLFIGEIKMLQRLKHNNIIQICGAIAEPLAVILEHMSFDFTHYGAKNVKVNNLSQFLKKLHCHKAVESFNKNFDIMRLIALDTANALSYLHNNGISHRDLKPANILVTSTRHGKALTNQTPPVTCKVTDFGEAKAYSIRTNSNAASRTNYTDKGTLPFQAPEVVMEVLKSAKLMDLRRMDIWAFGCVVFCMLNPDLSHPYEQEYQWAVAHGTEKQLRKVIRMCMRKGAQPEHSEEYSELKQSLPDLEDVMEAAMTFDPMARPAIFSVVKYVKKYVFSDRTWALGFT